MKPRKKSETFETGPGVFLFGCLLLLLLVSEMIKPRGRHPAVTVHIIDGEEITLFPEETELD